ncbi:MAG: SEC-C domain-containing protein, partial [Planctomycetes bacterium]|nr:SEC-C domain-containing protein [Planctomycetota bacterium]
IDTLWIDHLTTMEQMRLEAGWQALRQVKAVDAYKSEGFKQFQELLAAIRHTVARTIYHVSVVQQQQAPPPRVPVAAGVARGGNRSPQPTPPAKLDSHKVGRNDPCPCGSGKKYKKCHGR